MTGSTNDDINGSDFVDELVRVAFATFTEQAKPAKVQISPDLVDILIDSVYAASAAHHAYVALEQFPSDRRPAYLELLAGYTASAVVRERQRVFPHGFPEPPAHLRALGAADYVQGCALVLAARIVANDLPEDVPTALSRLLNQLHPLVGADNPTHRAATLFLRELSLWASATGQGDPEGDRVRSLLIRYLGPCGAPTESEPEVEPARNTTPETSPETGSEPTGPRLEPESVPTPKRRARHWAKVGASVAAVVVLALALVAAGFIGRSTVSDEDRTVPPASSPTPDTRTAAPPTPVPFTAPVLADAELEVFAYPDPDARGPAVVDHPELRAEPQALPAGRVLVDMGQWFRVEIKLRSTNPDHDPNDHYYLRAVITGGLMARVPDTTEVSYGDSPPERTDDFTAQIVPVQTLDERGAYTTYTVTIATLPQEQKPGAPSSGTSPIESPAGADPNGGYMCGFNAHGINVILNSTEHPNSVMTTVPVYVLRTNNC